MVITSSSETVSLSKSFSLLLPDPIRGSDGGCSYGGGGCRVAMVVLVVVKGEREKKGEE